MRDPSALAVPLRVAFAAAWIGVQGVLIATAGDRPDAAFGFRMFSESSAIEVHLSRVVRRGAREQKVDVHDGAWTVTAPPIRGVDDAGPPTLTPAAPQHRSWRDRVRDPLLCTFDRWFAASYSADTQVTRWHAALDDVAAHLEPDGETRSLVLDITIKRNGHDPVVTTFTRDLAAPLATSGKTP